MHLDRLRHAVYFWSIATSTFTEPDQRSTSRYIGKRVLKDRHFTRKRVRVRVRVCHQCFSAARKRGEGIGMRARCNVGGGSVLSSDGCRRPPLTAGRAEARLTKRGPRSGVRTQWWSSLADAFARLGDLGRERGPSDALSGPRGAISRGPSVATEITPDDRTGRSRHSRSHSSAGLATTSRRYFVLLSRRLPRLACARTKAGLPYREP